MSAFAPDILSLLDAHLLAKHEAEPKREVTGGMMWRASTLGACLRRQYLEGYLKRESTQEFDAKSLRRFEVGHQWGRQFSRWFQEMGFEVQEEVEMADETLNIGAHGDYIVGRFHSSEPPFQVGIELKSVNSKWFWYRTKAKETTAAPEHLMQSAVYDILARKKNIEIPWVVLTVSKDDLWMIQDQVTQEHREIAMERLLLLGRAVLAQEPPPCTCKDKVNGRFNGKEYVYCPYGGEGLEGECCQLC